MKRIDFVDNLKGVLIILVVIGHFLLRAPGTPSTILLYKTIYLFHMPLFIFVSGFLSKRIYLNGEGLRVDKILSFIALALLFQAILVGLESGFDRIIPSLVSMTFSGAPWYLISLSTWYASLPIISKVRPIHGLVISFVVALLSGCIPHLNCFLSLSRTVVFLPFFLLGYYCDIQLLTKIAHSKLLFIAAGLSFAFLIAFFVTNGELIADQYPLVYATGPYEGSAIAGVSGRLIIYSIAALLSLSIILATPKRKSRVLALFGQRTLQIYILHRILRAIMELGGFFSLPIMSNGLESTALLVTASLAVTIFCSIPAFGKPFDAAVKAKWLWLLKPDYHSMRAK